MWPWPPTDPVLDEASTWLLWITRLRWVAIVAQLVTLSFAFNIVHSPTVLVPLVVVSVVLVAVNLQAMNQLSRREEGIDDPTLVVQLLVDVLALTAYFLLAGGPDNPFAVLYLVHVAMAAIMLKPRSALAVTVVAIVCYGLLFAFHLPLHLDRHTLPPTILLRLGQFMSFVISSVSIGVFVVGLANGLRQHRERLIDAKERTSRTDRLRAVGTLAAGAAHELNTPLSTIGLRVRRLARRHDDADSVSDIEVIRRQLDRCKLVIDQLLVGAGDPSAAEIGRHQLGDLVAEGLRLWSKGTTMPVDFDNRAVGVYVELPRIAFIQALINLLENAREAQEDAGVFSPIDVQIRADPENARVVVRDHGIGLPPETPDRVGEPFFTTKKKGTGLGVFVARSVADGAGGGLGYESGEGWTEAHWWFPVRPMRGTRQNTRGATDETSQEASGRR